MDKVKLLIYRTLRKTYRTLGRKKHDLVSFLLYLSSADFTEKYIYVSHHKCATQYTMQVLRDICVVHGLRTADVDWRFELRPYILNSSNFIFISDYSKDVVDICSIEARGFHVIRDPRDILISIYFSHRYTHVINTDEIRRNRRVLSSLDKREGIRYLFDHSNYFKRVTEEMENWDYNADNFYETSFERLTTKPADEFRGIFKFLGLEVDPSTLQVVLEKYSFDALRKRIGGHYRKGKHGDWQNHLAGENKRLFKRSYGELLIKLGYEKDYSW